MNIVSANLARSSVQTSSNANQLQHGAQVTVKDKAAYKVSKTALPPPLPAITILPAHPIDINRRALAQSTRYIAAQSKMRDTSDSVRIDVQGLEDVTGDVSIIPARDLLESQSTSKKQDFDAAGILLAVAQEQRAITTTPKLGEMSVAIVDELEENYIFNSSWICPVSTCIDHHKRFSSRLEWRRHTRTHFKGMGCAHSDCHWSVLIYKDLDNLLAHTKSCHWLPSDDTCKRFKCQSCFHNLNRSDYLDHLDDCIVHMVQREASGKARPCPMSSCDHHLTDFPSRYHRGLHLFHCHMSAWMRHYIVTDCKRCPKWFELENQFTRHILENHNNRTLKCHCCGFWFNEEKYLEHFNSCYFFLMELTTRSSTSF